ncbi:extensin, partial [Herbaspirillum sp. HC18]
ESGQCGTAAPMKLVSIGTGTQQVTFSPPPLVTCDLIAGLAKWLRQDLQGLARKHLGAPITRIETMSSYSCRAAYGRPGNRLSEHGRANALDIAAFVTDKNQMVSVEVDWGATAREIAASQKRDDATQPHRPQQASKPEPLPPSASADASALPNLPGISLHFSGLSMQPALGFEQPSRLGGPKPRNAAAAVIPPPPPAPRAGGPTQASRAEFLRNAHKVACRTFGTVLGPEA